MKKTDISKLFVKFVNGSQENKFFFECALAAQGGTVYLRDLGSTCPYPPTTDVVSPTAQNSQIIQDTLHQILGDMPGGSDNNPAGGTITILGSDTTGQILKCLITASTDANTETTPDALFMAQLFALRKFWI